MTVNFILWRTPSKDALAQSPKSLFAQLVFSGGESVNTAL